MKKYIILSVFILFCAGHVAAQVAEKRAMTTDDALNMVNVGNEMISPDGEWVFFSKSELDWSENERNTKYFIIPADGGEAFQYIGEEGGSSFQFSPDGKYLTFKRTVDDHSQIFIMRTSGGEATQLTEHKNSVGTYKWSADAARIFFSAGEPRSEEDEKKYKDGYDMIFVDEGPSGQTTSSWSNLWIFDVETREEEKITDEEFIFGDFDISPDGERVVFTARYTNRRNDADKNEIYIINVSDKMKTRLTTNNAPEGGLSWAPDGRKFAFTAADDKEWMNRNTKIWIMDPNTREHRLLSGKIEGNIRAVFWTPDSRYILFSGQQRTNTNLFRMNVETGNYEQLTHVEGTLNAGSFSKDRKKFVYTFTDYDTPSDIYASTVDNFEPVRLTDANPWVEEELLLAQMKTISWKSKNDYEIEGLLHVPAQYQEGNRIPLILNIHGGPAGVFTNSFRASYHVYAGLGYASLSPNVRGSSGYTDHLREGNTFAKGDGIGLGDYWDLMNGVDYVIEQGYVDPDRMGVKGWSYGGILGGWTITQTDRFKAASIGAGVYDWTSEYGPGFNNDVRLWHIGGTPWDNPEGYRHQSALTHVKNVVTPTLLIHGVNDRTDTEQQSMMFFTALKDIGKIPVRYIKAPREPHGFREPRHQRTRDTIEIQWMQKYILGEEWEPWEREEDKKEAKEQ
ncbi:prolyl oligopeptidase family serine peptidase [candidate division KSB1 bacterium]